MNQKLGVVILKQKNWRRHFEDKLGDLEVILKQKNWRFRSHFELNQKLGDVILSKKIGYAISHELDKDERSSQTKQIVD